MSQVGEEKKREKRDLRTQMTFHSVPLIEDGYLVYLCFYPLEYSHILGEFCNYFLCVNRSIYTAQKYFLSYHFFLQRKRKPGLFCEEMSLTSF
jgi:hypothetical protein